jgi:hypothetical protein
MMGQVPPCGTGDTQIIVDDSMLEMIDEDEDQDFEELEDNESDYDIDEECLMENLEFQHSVSLLEED